MFVSGFDPDKATSLSVISACGKAGDLFVAIGTALVDMYSKS